jgi:hypothetical protein
MMNLRAVLVAALTLAVFGSQASYADEGSSSHPRYHRHRHVYHGSASQYAPGHGDGENQKPFLYVEGPYSNSPYFNNQTFWERVIDGQPDYPVR